MGLVPSGFPEFSASDHILAELVVLDFLGILAVLGIEYSIARL